MHIHDVSSEWIRGPRRVTVWTPPPGKSGAGPLPLLLLHDGQNLFDADRAHAGRTWRVAETALELVASGRMSPIVIAGVDHGQEDRARELTPTPGDQVGAGQAWRYGRFVVEELVPMLARTYSVRVDAGGLAMGGSSLGGLATLAVALQYPARFGRLLLMSPSLWWDDRVLLRRMRHRRLSPGTRVWLDCGHQEGRMTIANVRHLRRLLVEHLAPDAVAGREDPSGDHSEDSGARRLPDALEWLFPATMIKPAVACTESEDPA